MRVFREYAAAVSQPRLLPGPSRYDEVAAPDGSLRATWRRLAAESDDIELADLTRIGAEIDRVITDDGVIYTPRGEPSVNWRLDPVPIVLDSADWAGVETGLTQRTELLNAILADVYGPQRLLAQGHLPAQLVFGHSGFLRIVARRSSAATRPLVIAATDLGRGADGHWRVLADRAQAPSGIGFAMENRRVVSRVLPEAYRSALPHRLAPFFQALRATLLQLAPDGVDNPRVVVLSPGPMSETAYDQSAIASRLGFPLVEGADLVVQDGSVFMRVLGRLERVDVILRRVDASWSDPLELRGESQLGVAGLAEAVRRGSVTVVNGLGSGVLENPGLLPYLPRLCEILLDEPLRLPSVPTWWAGDPAQRQVVLDRVEELAVRLIDAPQKRVTGPADTLRAKICAEPHRYVGQERLALSVAPTLDPAGELGSRELRLRTFTMWHRASYRTMFGALASTAVPNEPNSPGISKDVWVLKSSTAEPDQGLDHLTPVSSARTPVAMGPRILEDLFWLGRYVERLQDTVRLVICAHGLAQDFQDRPSTTGGQTLATVMGAIGALSPGDIVDDQSNLQSLLLDEARAGSVADAIWHLRRVSQGVRDQVSSDLFRVFGAVDRAQQAVRDNPHSAQVGESAGRLLTDALALSGVTDNMMRDAGWHLIEIGTAIERAMQLVALLRSTLTVRQGIDVEHEVLSAVLGVAESVITHRRRYRGGARVSNVLDLLLLDADNPRSLRFVLRRAHENLARLPGSTGSTRPERLVDDLLAELDRGDLAALAAVDGVSRPELAEFTARLQRQLRTLSDAVAEVHFPFGPAQRTFDLSTGGGQ